MKELLVIKVGTSTLVDAVGNFDDQSFYNISEQIKEQREQGREVALVTSGAISAGANQIGRTRGEFSGDIDKLSALAAIGQVPLMKKWSGYLEPLVSAQNLITPRELQDTQEGTAYIRKLVATLAIGAVPIVNENDAVADDEIKIGDNDRLSALVAARIQYVGIWNVRLLILSDVNALYDKSSGTEIRVVEDIASAAQYVFAHESEHGVGGMATKLQAAGIARTAGVETTLGNGREKNIIKAMLRRRAGTRFVVG